MEATRRSKKRPNGKLLRLCHSALHADDVRPVRMYRSMFKRDSGLSRCVVTRTYPSFTGRISALGVVFSPDAAFSPPMIACVFESSLYDLRTLARRAASANSALCAGSAIVRYGLYGVVTF